MATRIFKIDAFITIANCISESNEFITEGILANKQELLVKYIAKLNRDRFYRLWIPEMTELFNEIWNSLFDTSSIT